MDYSWLSEESCDIVTIKTKVREKDQIYQIMFDVNQTHQNIIKSNQ